MNTKLVKEGTTEFSVFKSNYSKKGPGKKEKTPFYNPAMELNRDVSLIVNQWLIDSNNKNVKILDGLAASGARGVRFCNELNGDFEVIINDWDKDAYNLIKKNIKQNHLENVISSNYNLNVLLLQEKFDSIDIDPFGSPIYFIDSAMKSIRHKGIIACTATDSACLCGVYPKVCKRRYGAIPFHCNVMHEIGLRILLGVLCREAGKYDKGIYPVLSYTTDHYYRIYIQIRNGVNAANDSIQNLNILKSEEIECIEEKRKENIGPLWTGKLHNKKIIKNLRSILSNGEYKSKNLIWKLFELLEEEADAPMFFYSTEYLASKLKMSPPKMDIIFERLKEKGFDVSKTHFSVTGFKTTASKEEVLSCFYK